jgi:hypothetical protein
MKMSFRKSSNQPLYLFQHIPKCAGTTIINTIEGQLKHKSVNLEGKYGSKTEVWGHLVRQNLDIDNIVSIHGHRTFYGLHSMTNRKYRYYTFLRNPIDRVISLYNFWADCKAREHIMYRDGNLISFQDFLKTDYVMNNTIRFLYYAMEGERTPGSQIINFSDYHLDVAKRFLDHCWFIGFVENFEEDFNLICSAMGIKSSKIHKRASKKYFQLSQEPAVKEQILEINQLDVKLFEYAKQLRKG